MRNPEYHEKTIDLSQVTDKRYHIMLYQLQSAWVGFELTTLVVIWLYNCRLILTLYIYIYISSRSCDITNFVYSKNYKVRKRDETLYPVQMPTCSPLFNCPLAVNIRCCGCSIPASFCTYLCLLLNLFSSCTHDIFTSLRNTASKQSTYCSNIIYNSLGSQQ
jgi:hypothetical protein